MPMEPPPPKRTREVETTVLSEEEWIASLEGIIERDFFPELVKLRQQNEENYVEDIRTGSAHHGWGSTEGGQRRVDEEAGTTHAGMQTVTPGHTDVSNQRNVPPRMTLDQFVRKYTSEDNASFREILNSVNAKRREKAAVLLMPPNPGQDGGQNDHDGRQRERITDGYGTSGQGRDVLKSWKYAPVNLLMYDGSSKESLPLSRKEMQQGSKEAQVGINYAATSLDSRIEKKETAMIEDAINKDGEARGGRKTYNILSTPSFDPERDVTPMMTWGEVEATPLRIEENEDAARAHKGFSIKETPKREVLAHSLGRRASTSLEKRAMVTPSPASHLLQHARRRSAGQGYGTPMSPAARHLAARMSKSKRHGETRDSSLRASYSSAAPKASHSGGWETPS